MRTIALTTSDAAMIGRLHQAFPDFELLQLSIERLERVAAQRRLAALVVDENVLGHDAGGGGAVRLALLKARLPQLATIALLPLDSHFPERAFELGRARVDAVLVSGAEDHPNQLRQVFAKAAMSTVAHTIENACQPGGPALVASNLLRALARLRTLKHPHELAAGLGRGLTALRRELHAARLFTPRIMLAWFRVLASARLLGDTTVSIEHIAEAQGLGSATALRNAYSRLLRTTPHDVQSGGGLWLASERFRHAVEERRLAGAGVR